MKNIFGILNSSRPTEGSAALAHEPVAPAAPIEQRAPLEQKLPVHVEQKPAPMDLAMDVTPDQAQAVTVLGEKHEQIIARLGQVGEILSQVSDAQKLIEKLALPLRDTFQHHQSQRSENISLRNALESTRFDVTLLRETETSLAARVASLEMELKHLHEAHAQALTAQHSVEEELRLANSEVRVRDADIIEFQRRLSDLSVELAHTRDDLQDTRNQLHEQEAVYNSLDIEVRREREGRQTLEQEYESLQASVQQAVSEAIHMSKRLADTEQSSAETRARTLQLEGLLSEMQAEKARLIEELDALNLTASEEKRSLSVKTEGLRSRSTTLERLLGETRTELAKQTEGLRDAQRRMTEMSIALNRAEAKAEKASTQSHRADSENKNLEQSRVSLLERSDMLSKAIKAKDAALKRSEERGNDLAERLSNLESKLNFQVESYERRVSELTAALEREKTERALLDGALDAARQDKARVQKELIKMRSRFADETYGEDIVEREASQPVDNVAPLHPPIERRSES